MSRKDAFEEYCRKEGIVSEQYKTDIYPVWEAALASASSAKPVACGFINKESGQLKSVLSCPPDNESEWDDVYTVPPILSAAVTAAIERCAKECVKVQNEVLFHRHRTGDEIFNAILALRTAGGLAALREFGLRIADAVLDDVAEYGWASAGEVVDRVMKGE